MASNPASTILLEEDYKTEDKYGLHRGWIRRVRRVQIEDLPFTEEDEDWNRKADEKYKQAERHSQLSKKLSNLLDDRIFIADCVSNITSLITSEEVPGYHYYHTDRIKYEETDKKLEMADKMRTIETRTKDANLTYSTDLHTLEMLSKTLLRRNLAHHHHDKNFPEPDTPEILFRALKSSAHSRHDKRLGIRSSTQPLAPPIHHAHTHTKLTNKTLKSSSLVTRESLRNQCQGSLSSDLIALTDSPSRAFNIIKCWDFSDISNDAIAVINVSKLRAMGVLFNRTTTLAESLDMPLRSLSRPNGLEYANGNYWVAYRWIPAECIECYVSISSLREACGKRGIDEYDYSTRLMLDDLSDGSLAAELGRVTLELRNFARV